MESLSQRLDARSSVFEKNPREVLLNITNLIAEEELLTLWVADKLYEMVRNEAVGLKSIDLVRTKLNIERKSDQSAQQL